VKEGKTVRFGRRFDKDFPFAARENGIVAIFESVL
jgi:hypothetical protein